MPKIEAGNSSGQFKIDGKSYNSGDYEVISSGTGATAVVKIIATASGRSIMSYTTVTDITDSNDVAFTDLDAFETAISSFFFRSTVGGLGSIVGLKASDDFSSDTIADYTVSGAYTTSPNISGGGMSFEASTASFANTIMYDNFTSMDVNIEMEAEIVLDSIGGANDWIALTWRHTDGRIYTFRVLCAATLQGRTDIFHQDTSLNSVVGTGNMTTSNGDVITLKVSQKYNHIVVTARNQTNDSYTTSIFNIYDIDVGATIQAPNIKQFGFQASTGQYTINSWSVRSTSKKNVPILSFGDSLALSNSVVEIEDTWMEILAKLLGVEYAIIAGGGSRTDNHIEVVQEVIDINPTICLYQGGQNDINAAVSIGTIQTNIASIASSITGAGINFVPFANIPTGNATQQALSDHIMLTYPNAIDLNRAMRVTTTSAGSTDYIASAHYNDNGAEFKARLVYHSILPILFNYA